MCGHFCLPNRNRVNFILVPEIAEIFSRAGAKLIVLVEPSANSFNILFVNFSNCLLYVDLTGKEHVALTGNWELGTALCGNQIPFSVGKQSSSVASFLLPHYPLLMIQLNGIVSACIIPPSDQICWSRSIFIFCHGNM